MQTTAWLLLRLDVSKTPLVVDAVGNLGLRHIGPREGS